MCGLIFVSRRDGLAVDRMVAKRYQGQKNRGMQGFGYIGLDKKRKINSWKQATQETDILRELNKEWGSTIMFHHRMPTSTPNVTEATHPIRVSHGTLEYDYYLIHNGIISNADTMREKHIKLGFEYTTEMSTVIRTRKSEYVDEMEFNDSEALAIEMARVLDGKQPELECRGSIAFICYQVDKVTQEVKYLYFGRNFSNPLIMTHNENYLILASVGHGTPLEIDTLYRYDFEDNLVTKKAMEINGYRYTGFQNPKRTYQSNTDEDDDYGANFEYRRAAGTTAIIPALPYKQSFREQVEQGALALNSEFFDPKYTPVRLLLQKTDEIAHIYDRLAFAQEMLNKCKDANREGGITYWEKEINDCNEAVKFYAEVDMKLELEEALKDGIPNIGDLDGDGYPRDLSVL